MLQARVTTRNFGRALARFVELDPHGPVSNLFRGFALNPGLLSPTILAKYIKWIMGNKGRFQILDEYRDAFYVTRHETCLLGWRRCSNSSYCLFVLYRDALQEERVGKRCEERRGWWEYIPTASIWQGLESKDVIEHLCW